ncbi:MAG: transketolase [Planctomycetota bacterium]
MTDDAKGHRGTGSASADAGKPTGVVEPRAVTGGAVSESPGGRLPGDEAAGPLAAQAVDTLRTLAMDAVQAANSGHPGTPMALAPLAYALWTHGMRYTSEDPAWPDRDRFVLSCGHASMLLYGILHLTGYPLGLDDIRRFRQWDSPAAGHPEHGHVPGVETTTGPLGQGIANAVGMALAERHLAARFNREGSVLVDHRTWVIASDGDLMEGVSFEAASLAGHLGLGRLCVFWDDNRITIDGTTDLAFSEDVAARFRALGWDVLHVGDDEGVPGYRRAIDAALADEDRPTLVVCRTHIGAGSPGKQDTSAAHGAPLGADEVLRTKEALGWPVEPAFLVPDQVREHLTEAGRRGNAERDAWNARLAAARQSDPDRVAAFEAALAGVLPLEVGSTLDAVAEAEGGRRMATRKASGKVLAALEGVLPELVGGSADLAGSNNTRLPRSGDIRRGRFGDRNVHFGVREHGMASMLNGMALHGGVRPYGGTFLVFADYMRPAIRLAALMGLPVVYVFTHDSIGVGEDGPTHQPVEHLASLRAMPNLHVIRPADAAETVEAWRLALERRDGPTALVLTRQDLSPLDRTRGRPASCVADGAYVVRSGAEAPDVALLATGSEVGAAVEAAERLQGQGVTARVISMPCWERIDDAAFDRMCGGARVRVAIEAAASFGWHRFTGSGGTLVTLDRFGASAPAGVLFEKLGFTGEHVATVAKDALARAELGGAGACAS